MDTYLHKMKFIYLALLVVFFVCNTHAASFYGDVEQPVDADVAKELFQQFNKDNAVEHGTRAEDHHLLRWGYLGHETTGKREERRGRNPLPRVV